jgi:TolB protein
LIGKIAFKSDRTGQEEIYVINPDGTGLALLTDPWPYEVAKQADAYSADGRFRVIVRTAIRYKEVEIPVQGGTEKTFARDDAPALFWYDAHYNDEAQLTTFGSGSAYDAVWSPTAEQVAFVSDDSGNDEIWVANRDGSGFRQLTFNDWEWDKHPSWSPDGQQLVFWSNRTGVWQIWVINADGTGDYTLSRTGFNDWEPVWIKYPRVPVYSNP